MIPIGLMLIAIDVPFLFTSVVVRAGVDSRFGQLD